MERNEIRFGNYIIDGNEDSETGYIRVDAVLMELIMYHPETFEPIPLTEEWLIKLGIPKQNHWDKSQSYYRIEVPNDYGGYIVGENYNGEFKVRLVGCDDGRVGNFIQYVHQLQNLYFALTGEELKIKESTLQT